MTSNLPTLEREIRTLLEHPAPRASRDSVEYTLTTGYAHALQLDAERLHAEHRLRALVRSPAAARLELAAATTELERARAELARLRALLASLRAHAL